MSHPNPLYDPRDEIAEYEPLSKETNVEDEFGNTLKFCCCKPSGFNLQNHEMHCELFEDNSNSSEIL